MSNVLSPQVSAAVVGGWFGDGSDGDVTISSTITLARDMYYANLNVQAGGRIKTGGFRVFVLNTLVCDGNISSDGNPGFGQSHGTGSFQFGGFLGGGVDGGDGGSGGFAGSSGGTTPLNPTANRAGTGGNGGMGTASGGLGGLITASAAANGSLGDIVAALWGQLPRNSGSPISGGAGGGGGGSTSTDTGAGGGGGGGGGYVVVSARLVTGSGTISANGGPGATATNLSAGALGGGGGGGGGYVIMIVGSGSVLRVQRGNNTPLGPGVLVQVEGGEGGLAAGGGDPGDSGGRGSIVVFNASL